MPHLVTSLVVARVLTRMDATDHLQSTPREETFGTASKSGNWDSAVKEVATWPVPAPTQARRRYAKYPGPTGVRSPESFTCCDRIATTCHHSVKTGKKIAD